MARRSQKLNHHSLLSFGFDPVEHERRFLLLEQERHPIRGMLWRRIGGGFRLPAVARAQRQWTACRGQGQLRRVQATRVPRIKICCIASHAEAGLAVRAGADAVGLVSAMPSGPGPIPEDLIAQIAARVPPPVLTFLLTSLRDAGAIAAQHRRCATTTIQLCDRLEAGAHAVLRRDLPVVRLVQVIHVRDAAALDEAVRVAPHVDALLLDSGNPQLAVKELGGTGRVHDWSLSRAIREAVDVPVFLAGGLRPSNVREAIEAVGPFGLDVCSGVRTDGRLDPEKVTAFIAAAGASRAFGAS